MHPFASSLHYSFTSYDSLNGISKFDLMNYKKISMDKGIVCAFKVTFKYAVFGVPLRLAFISLIAYILNSGLKGVNFLRTAYYIPPILGGSTVIAIL